MEKLSLIYEIKKVNGDMFRGISKRYKSLNVDITPVQAKILLSLYRSDKLLCQKDLEKPLSCNKSTLSSVISTMEKNGLLSRQVSESDSRINYLVLTDKGLEMIDFLKEDRAYTEEILTEGITDLEYTTFMQVVGKIRKNIERI